MEESANAQVRTLNNLKKRTKVIRELYTPFNGHLFDRPYS